MTDCSLCCLLTQEQLTPLLYFYYSLTDAGRRLHSIPPPARRSQLLAVPDVTCDLCLFSLQHVTALAACLSKAASVQVDHTVAGLYLAFRILKGGIRLGIRASNQKVIGSIPGCA